METSVDKTSDKQKKFPFRIPSRIYLYVVAGFALLGVAGGYAYYWFVGCQTGGCAITSSPYLSMAWGGMLGYLLPDIFIKKQEEKA